MNLPKDQAAIPHASPVWAGDLFVGRVSELQKLRAGLVAAIAGNGRLFLIEGEAGIGKTRLAQELASFAREDGVTVLWGRCYEDTGVPPYWPWIEIIRGFAATHDIVELRVALGAGAGDVVEIVPEILEKLPGVSVSERLKPSEAQFRVLDSIKAFIKRVAEGNPLLLILDDLHWSDRSSLRILEMLARDIGTSKLLVVVNRRDERLPTDHPLLETLGEISRFSGFQRIKPSALDREEVDRFVSGVLDGASSPTLVDSVYERTDGNPLFVLEVTRLLAQKPWLLSENNLRQDVWLANIPELIREVISKRLNRLSANCNSVLIVASVLGAEFGMRELEHVSVAHSASDIPNAVDEALSALLIEKTTMKREGFRFTHALIQQAIASQLTFSERRQLHHIIGCGLEELHASNTENHAAELAIHFSESGTIAGLEKSIRYFTAAGDRAATIYAYEEAVLNYGRALTEKETQPMDSETASILHRLSRSHFLAGAGEKALPYLTRAFCYYETAKEITRAVDVVELPYMPALGAQPSVTGEAVNQLRKRALELVPAGSHRAGRLMCQIAQIHDFQNGYDSARAMLQQALDIGRGKRDPALQARALANFAQMDISNLRLAEVTQKATEAIDLAKTAQDNYTERFALNQAGFSVLVHGDPVRAQMFQDGLLEFEERLRISLLQWQGHHLQQSICQFTGDWEKARKAIDCALGISGSDFFSLHNLAILAYETGAIDTCGAALEKMISDVKQAGHRAGDSWKAIVCVAIAKTADSSIKSDYLAVGELMAKAILASPTHQPKTSLHAKLALLLIALNRGDTDMMTELGPENDDMEATWMTPWGNVSTDRLFGLRARALGFSTVAESFFNTAKDFCAGAGYRPELAWTCYDLAALLLERNDTPDPERARALLGQAKDITQELGMITLGKLLAQKQDEAYPKEVTREPPVLTKREMEVLKLVAKGKTNQEIAFALFISENTVGNHVSSILAKTKTGNRTEAALYGAQRGLVGN
jgi:DNA-binding CsgD family transcriptional regulator